MKPRKTASYWNEEYLVDTAWISRQYILVSYRVDVLVLDCIGGFVCLASFAVAIDSKVASTIKPMTMAR